jgi:ABC-type transport system substrate-binding protein
MIKYGDKDPQLRDIKLGNLDAILSGSLKWATAEKDNKDITTWSYPTPGFSEIAFNSCTGAPESLCTGVGKGVHKAVVQDPAIRHALYYALNRPEVLKTVLQGQGTVGNGLISPYFKRWYQDWSKDPTVGYQYDPAKAKQALQEGGWNCPAGGVCQKNGVPASFELLVRQNNQDDQNAAQRYAADAKAVGIDMKLSIVSEDQINERIYATSPKDENKYEPTYDAFYWGWGGDNDSPAFNFDVLVCGSSWQDSMYCNPQYDKLVADALKEQDETKRADLWHQAEKLALTDAPYLITVHDNTLGRALRHVLAAAAVDHQGDRRRWQLEHRRDRRGRCRPGGGARHRRVHHPPPLEVGARRARAGVADVVAARGDPGAGRARHPRVRAGVQLLPVPRRR